MITVNPPCQPGKQDIHLWQWQMDSSPAHLEPQWQFLSDEERRRADAYRFDIHRIRFVSARGRLRLILAAYLGCTPAQVTLGYGPAGKPYSLLQPAQWHLCFNLSHSEDTAALAVSAGIEVGIDIEHIRPIDDDVLPQIFSGAERTQFEGLPTWKRDTTFFENWSRKEACLKALGTGLQTPPTDFEFDLESRENAKLRRVNGNEAEASQWQVLGFIALGGCPGAVAARSKGWSLLAVE